MATQLVLNARMGQRIFRQIKQKAIATTGGVFVEYDGK